MTTSTRAPGSERFTVTLVDDASKALQALMRRTGLNKTDTINRALQIYDLFDRAQRDGKVVYFGDSGGDLERVRIL